jgi:DNA-binding transcriptional MocR family regulator
MKEILYQKIASGLESQIKNGTLKTGAKMPSLRLLHKEYGVSLTTTIQAYLELESKGLIVSRPQSGYYVQYKGRELPVPSISHPAKGSEPEYVTAIISKIYSNLHRKDVMQFGMGVPENGLLPLAKLNKELTNAMRSMEGGGTDYDLIEGNQQLRNNIARLTYTWGGSLSGEDLVTTAGAMNALSFALMATTQKGDSIAVESPVYFGILQLARNLGLQIIELPTHPITGIDIAALKKVLPNIKACLLVSNFSNPSGSCMPEENKKAVVKMLSQEGIALIEDDLYGDLYFGAGRPKPCKAFDEEGLVLWIGSVSKTLAPGYRVGWMAPGKFRDKIMELKFSHSFSATTITQAAIAHFLEKGRYEHHLRSLRKELQTNSLQYASTIAAHFPEGTKISRPQGGFMLWVELDKRIDTGELYDRAIRQKISLAPGRMFSLQNQFHHCMRLSYGLRWSEATENKLKQLGKIVKSML